MGQPAQSEISSGIDRSDELTRLRIRGEHLYGQQCGSVLRKQRTRAADPIGRSGGRSVLDQSDASGTTGYVAQLQPHDY